MIFKIDNIVTGIVVGIAVAAFSYFVLTDRPGNSDVSMTYRNAEMGDELVQAADDSIDSLFKFWPYEEVPLDMRQKLRSLSFLGTEISGFQAIENLDLKNNDGASEATVRVRGVNAGLVSWDTRSNGHVVLRGDFDQQLQLLPQEHITIRHYTRFASVLAQSSDAVLVYANNRLLFDETTRYPIPLVLLAMFGVIFLVSILPTLLNLLFPTKKELEAKKDTTPLREIEREAQIKSSVAPSSTENKK